MRLLYSLSLLLLVFAISVNTSCKKTPASDPVIPDQQPPVDTTVTTPPEPPAPDIIVDNKWQCEVNGILYSGTIDTGFQDAQFDSLIYCTGTSNDKKANIAFWININRKAHPDGVLSSVSYDAYMNFDTASTAIYTSSPAYDIKIAVDSFVANKIKGTFSGVLSNYGGVPPAVRNGKFSFQFGKGDNEPKQMSFIADDSIPGYIHYARIESNTLIIDGLPYKNFSFQDRFRLMIHTGGTIKPGTYKSKDGNAGFNFYRPSVNICNVGDTLGDLTVTINSVNNNIVEGTFNGYSEVEANPVANGRFRCRVINYKPEADSVNKWKFLEDFYYLSHYSIWGGNVTKSTKSKIGSLYYLTIKGQSNHNASQFKLVIKSLSPIDTGMYENNPHVNNVDSLYFKTGDKYFFQYDNFDQRVYCHIDAIDDKKVSGTIGQIVPGGELIRKGYFSGTFY